MLVVFLYEEVIMGKVKDGDTVKVHCKVKKEDGAIFGSSKGGPPIEFKIGEGGIISGLEEGVVGLEIGETKSISVPPEKAFGPIREELFKIIKEDELPENLQPVVGQLVKMVRPDGKNIDFRIAEINADKIILNGNHPLAGETLTLDVEVVEIL
jgi:peptidylprolyl isomerase